MEDATHVARPRRTFAELQQSFSPASPTKLRATLSAFVFFAGIVTVCTCLEYPIGHDTENSLNGTSSTIGGRNGNKVLVTVKKTEYVTIGNASIPKTEVTAVGDIDSNGYTDYIVAKPHLQNRAGSIRPYFMSENNTFLYSREIVPGMWGFKATLLRSGDMFGSAVLRLPHGNKELSCQIAVGAPGDAGGRGAIFLLKLSARGSVSGSEKISADTDYTLAKQHGENEGFGSEIKAIADLNGDEGMELAVKSLSGSTTLVFMNSAGDVQLGLKMHGTGKNDPKQLAEVVTAVERTRFNEGALSMRTG